MSTHVAAPTLDGFEPFSPEYLKDPPAALQDLMRETPVGFHPPLGAYVVMRYDDMRAVINDFETFSSNAYKALPIGADLRDRVPEEYERAAQVIIGTMALILDPPAHTVQRKAQQRTFTRPRIAAAADDIEAKANALIDAFVDEGSCDLLQDFAYQLTLSVVGDLIGLPRDQLPGFHAWIGDVFGLMAPIDAEPGQLTRPEEEVVAAYQRMHGAYTTYLEMVAERRRNPGDDVTSALLQLTDDAGAPLLSDEAVLSHMVGITVAGTDTTANLIASVVRQLTADPGLLAEVRADESLWTNLVEEGLRRTGIAIHLFRRTTRDTEVRGVPIPAGSMVCLPLSGANTDPDKFPDPLAFDIHRPNLSEHMAFGLGRHFCLGAPLARPEAAIALQTLYRRLPSLKADLDQELEFIPALTVRGVLHQRVTW
ncbi:MAG TPA: cytochrome P450 [Baekduia sp.]|uniref:cytochrome P450 n=1 Tax=Baekduia sp. TaxID=2600305 RepID=UPI002D790ABB|nr:cytochrome P450 [Baekduia sp.]HET6509018.1 cytochrome P450 [Baekduia sp.]